MAAVKDDRALTNLILDLVRFLSADDLAVADVAGRVGPVVEDPGGLIPIELRPILPGVRAARLARYPDSGLPYVIELELAPDARPAAAALKPILGDYDQARTDRGMPREILFYPPAQGTRWRVAVIAQVESNGDLENAPITSIAFRRDPVTP
jgi:hypothetical protein